AGQAMQADIVVSTPNGGAKCGGSGFGTLSKGGVRGSVSGHEVVLATPNHQDFVCSSHAHEVWLEHAAPAFSLFRCGSRGRQPHQCCRAAAAHGAAIAEPADP